MSHNVIDPPTRPFFEDSPAKTVGTGLAPVPTNVNPNRILLIGTGNIAREYAKVLDAQNQDFWAIGRSEEGCKSFERDTGHKAIPGGVSGFLSESFNPNENLIPENAVVTVNPNQLAEVACDLLKAGVRRILLEKPAGLNKDEIQAVRDTAREFGGEVYVAYNRRFYASTLAGERQIEEDGGVLSFHFEFTEWSDRITALPKPKEELEAWFLANSTHVVDTAFFLGGQPKSMRCVVSGSLPWYKHAAAFAGCGVTDKGAVFSYQANWNAPGRWSVEILTARHRLIYRPMEQLQIQEINSVAVSPVEIDDTLDMQFKPGLYLQVEAFLAGNTDRMLTIEEQLSHMDYYDAMQDGTEYFSNINQDGSL